MSAVTSRPRIRSVSSTTLSASAMVTAGAIVLTGRALATLVKSIDRTLASRLDETQRRVPQVEGTELRSIAASRRDQLQAERRVLASPSASTSPLETLKVSALAGLNAAAFAAPPAEMETPLRALAHARTADQVERAREALRAVVETSHVKVVTSSVAAACREAYEAIGFHEIELRPDPVHAGVRIIGTDGAGRALVSEVRVDDGRVGVDTEVVGVTDGSCSRILDDFDRALEVRGVRADKQRAYTGGVCRLAAARDTAERMARPMAPRNAEARRGQRLNASRQQTRTRD